MGEALAMGPLGQIARRVKDIAAARAWYGETLGLRHSLFLRRPRFF